MISAGEFRNGMTFDIDGQVFQIVEFQHVKPGKGAAFDRTKIRNVLNGNTLERTFNPTEKFPEAFVERRDMEYLYQDGNLYIFMDVNTYEQEAIDGAKLTGSFKFAKENEKVKVLSYKDVVFGVEMPFFVELEITESEPGVKGDTATNVTKIAKVETGAEIRVPMFINEGDKVRIDTRTGEYMDRVKS